MAKVQFDLTEKANKNVRVFMAENNISDKRNAINQMLEKFKKQARKKAGQRFIFI